MHEVLTAEPRRIPQFLIIYYLLGECTHGEDPAASRSGNDVDKTPPWLLAAAAARVLSLA